MVEIKCCPSTLAEGYNTYSPQAVKRLFDGKKVSPFLDFNINELKQSDAIVRAMQRISVSGVQEKFSGLIDKNSIRIAESSERSAYIIKPAPWDETIATRKQIPANEHVTMQIARQVYGIVTAEMDCALQRMARRCISQSGLIFCQMEPKWGWKTLLLSLDEMSRPTEPTSNIVDATKTLLNASGRLSLHG